MKVVSELVKKTMFRHYERGTWPYDVIVAVVLIATFVPPLFLESLRDGKTAVGAISDGNARGIHTVAIDEGLVFIGFASHGKKDPSDLQNAVRLYLRKNGSPERTVEIKDREGNVVGFLFIRDERRIR